MRIASAVIVVLVSACLAGTAVARPEARRCAPGSYKPLLTSRWAVGAAARHATAAYAAPNGRVVARFDRLNVNRLPTVFGVLGAQVDRRCRATWFKVRLPMRPNGSVGWVRARDVHAAKVRTRILVDLSSRRVTLYRDGRPILWARVAVGAAATPTPVGRYYVNQRLIPTNARGPFGPAAIGVSAFSNVHTGWAQGGPIGIHGTNEPHLLGQAVSNGCIRVRNDLIRRMFRVVLAGTPVEIRR